MKKLSPRETGSLDQICCLNTDNKQTESHWILINQKSVTIGKSSDGFMRIPRNEFNKIIDWYNTKQKIK